MNNIKNIQTTEYKAFIQNIKQKVQQAQIKASVKVNSVLLEFYWDLGSNIADKQKSTNWGSGFLKQMSKDLMLEFLNVKGFSKRNLERIRQWYLFYFKETSIATQPVSQFVGGDCYRTDYPIQKAFRRNLFFMQVLFNGGLKTPPYGFFENSKYKNL